MVEKRCTSGDAFDFNSFNLAINSRGPNPADLGSLSNLRALNSPLFTRETPASFSPFQIRYAFRTRTIFDPVLEEVGRHTVHVMDPLGPPASAGRD